MTPINPTYILLLGPPGSGKGTQAKLIQRAEHILHVASGDLFRENIKNQTRLGLEAKSYMDRGELVPDDVTTAMVLERLARPDGQSGALLDGFPRTVPQAESLDRALEGRAEKLDLVISIEVPDERIVERLSGRLICRLCGETYHVEHNPPLKPGVCDTDGGELYRREDDNPSTVRNRIQVYWTQTTPLIEYYESKGILDSVNGNQPIAKVGEEILGVLRARNLR
jgi:adenylate kinase